MFLFFIFGCCFLFDMALALALWTSRLGSLDSQVRCVFRFRVTLCRICRIVLHRMPGGVKILKTCRFQVPLRFQALLQVLFLVNGSRLVLYRLATKLLPLT